MDIWKMILRTRQRVQRVLLALVAIYFIGGAVLYFTQDHLLFHPKPLPKEYKFSFQPSFQEANILFNNNNVNIIKFKPAHQRKGVVLFYHGNMGNVEHYRQYPSIFLRNEYEIWMIDYPGFGKTTGKLTEKLLDSEALLMYDLAAKQISADSITIYGKSIGTGVASFVASKKNCRILILETPYYSIPSLAKNYFPIYPVNLMIKYSFPIHTYLKNIKCPITIFHGTGDEVISYKHSLRLKNDNKKIELISIQNGKHNDLSRYDLFQKKLDSLLAR